MKRIFVAGMGFTKIGDLWDKSIIDLAVEAGFKAMKASGTSNIDQVIVGNMFSAYSSNQEHLGAMIADGLGLMGVPAFKVEAANSSGSAALNVGYTAIKSGMADSALIIGVEKMRDLEPSKIIEAISLAESAEFTQFFGATFASLNAMLTKLYMQNYGVTVDELSAFPVLAHKNASLASHAQFRKQITSDDVAKSMIVSDPLRLLDCAPVGDGAAAIVMVSEEKASEAKSKVVELKSSTIATNRFNLYERDDMLEFSATRRAAEKALSKASVSIKDLDFIEVHDAFTIMAALSIEAMGLSDKGMGAKDAKAGRFDLKGEFPINTFGGLKARGNPIGATGVYQIAEAYLQLTDQAGQNQVKDAEFGMIHSLGGIDTTSIIHVLGRAD